MNSIFNEKISLEGLNDLCKGNMGSHLGIEFTEIGPDFLTAKMPVDERTRQPFGLLHGGASVVLAETIASIAANFVLLPEDQAHVVGLEINANHIKAVTSGFVYGTCKPLQLGRKFSVWEIRICTEGGALVCMSRMTAAIISRKRKEIS